MDPQDDDSVKITTRTRTMPQFSSSSSKTSDRDITELCISPSQSAQSHRKEGEDEDNEQEEPDDEEEGVSCVDPSPSVAADVAANTDLIPNESPQRHRHYIPSGLSALIQAATAQLGELIDGETNEHARGHSYYGEGKEKLQQPPTPRQNHSEENALHPATSDSLYRDNNSRDEETITSEEHNDRNKDYHSTSSSANPDSSPLMKPEQPDASKGKTFPITLMSLALDSSNEDTIAFLPDGKYFAMRARKFATDLMPRNFECSTWSEFLLLLNDWGFSRILHDEDDRGGTGSTSTSENASSEGGGGRENSMTMDHVVEVFRHPKFIKGEWELCGAIRYGESPRDARLSALPDRPIFEYAPVVSTLEASSAIRPRSSSLPSLHQQQQLAKRRLSPRSGSTIRRRNSDLTTLANVVTQHTQKKRMSWDASFSSRNFFLSVSSSSDETETHNQAGRGGGQQQPPRSSSSLWSRHDEIRGLALALTAEKLNLRARKSLCRASTTNENDTSSSFSNSNNDSKGITSSSTALVDQAVHSATHTIVTDAIETLLHDENHTKETYLKHSKELSRSALPGVVPISKQLFEQQEQRPINAGTTAADISSANGFLSSAPTPAEEEAASAIVAAAIAAEQRAHASFSFTTGS